jgi:hypothetical protein
VSAEPPAPTLRPRAVRIEYKGFQSVGDRREYLLILHRSDEPEEFRFSFRVAAFGNGGGNIRLQDAPDLCYQKLLQVAADGTPRSREVIQIEDADLVSYRVAHTPAASRRAAPRPSTTNPATPAVPRPPFVPRRAAEPPKPVVAPPPPAFDEGQRVRHAVFGDGVTNVSTATHTAVHFDEHGPKTFLTSLLALDVLSGPRVWETGPRGKNRLRTVARPD